MASKPFGSSMKKVTFVYQDKGDFLNDVCLTANDDAYSNDVSFGNGVGFA